MSARPVGFVQTKLSFSSEIVEWLEQRADEEGAPRESVFVAALLALLARYAGRDQVSLTVLTEGMALGVQLRLDGEPDAWQLLGRTAIALASAAPIDLGSTPSDRRLEQTVPGAAGGVEVVVLLDPSSPPVAADIIIQVNRRSLELMFREAHGLATWAAWHYHVQHPGAHAARIGHAPTYLERPQFPHPRLP